MRPVLVLDFDGVICSSAREVTAVAVEAYRDLAPRSALVAAVDERRHGRPWPDYDVAADPVFEPFLELLPLGNRAEDFGVACRAVEAGVELADQAAYDRYFDTVDAGWRRRYHEAFYAARTRLREADLDGWLALHRDYPLFSELLRRRGGDVVPAIATAKDRTSVRLLLERFGLAELFPDQRLLDKEAGVSKRAHLERLADRLGCAFRDMTFVDDKVNHLESVAPLGVRPVLAGWGFNGPREHAAARDRGWTVARLDDAEAVLFP